jgi:hypothetical protein
MRRLPQVAAFRTKLRDYYRSRSIEEVKCSGKTQCTMVVRRVLLVGRREGDTFSRMQAKLR